MSIYRTYPHCGAALDPGEVCDCIPSLYASLSPGDRERVNDLVHELLKKQNAAPSATNTEDGKVEKALTGPDSASYDTMDLGRMQDEQ